MENDHRLKSEDQMEIMMMMQQMDKMPEFCSAYSSDFSPCSNMSTIDELQAVESSSPPLMNFIIPGSVSLGNIGEKVSHNNNNNKQSSVAAMREMIFRIAVMQPIHIDPESVKPPKRRNVKISTDPQSVAARHRRERISERIRILQRLVPGGTKMDTASMLDEAIHYVKFLKTQVQTLERASTNRQIGTNNAIGNIGFPLEMSSGNYVPMAKPPSRMPQNVEQFGDA